MDEVPDWRKEIDKDFGKKNVLDKLHLSVHELSELGIGWLISSFVILYITGELFSVIQEGRISDEMLIYLFVLGISFFTHELMHKFTAIKFGARAEFKLSREAILMMLIGIIIGFPILATGAVYWWGEASSSAGIRGRVSASGPISNLMLAGVFLIFQGIGIFFLPVSTVFGSILYNIGFIGTWLNAFFGIFNMLPIGILDGAKVLAWDPKIWFSIIASLVIVMFLSGGVNLFL